MQKWTVTDRYGNTIYFTEERWLHILEARPELEPYFALFLETLRTGRREQDAIIPNEYLYRKRFKELLPENSHLIMVVVFKKKVDAKGAYVANNFVVTGWANYIWAQG
jgi:hypothetical protein